MEKGTSKSRHICFLYNTGVYKQVAENILQKWTLYNVQNFRELFIMQGYTLSFMQAVSLGVLF